MKIINSICVLIFLIFVYFKFMLNLLYIVQLNGYKLKSVCFEFFCGFKRYALCWILYILFLLFMFIFRSENLYFLICCFVLEFFVLCFLKCKNFNLKKH